MAEEYPVNVYIYDLTKGMARSMSGPLLGRQIDGVWHTGIVVHGQEFYFGGMGIESCPPRGTMLGQPDKIELLGHTQIPLDMFMDYLEELGSSSFKPDTYNLLEHNCNTFSDEIAMFLTGHPIPAYITNLPQEVLNTPLGAMLKPFIEAMSVNPSGGHSIQPEPSGGGQSIQPVSYGGAVHPVPTVCPAANGKRSSDQLPTPSVAKVTPISFKETKSVLDEFAVVKESLRTSLSPGDMKLMEEMVEYLKTDSPDWGLDRSHIIIIEKILKDSGFSADQKVAAAGLLQEVLGQSDVISMLVHDLQHTFLNILRLFEQHSNPVTERLAKGLCNCSSHTEGINWLTKAHTTKTADGIGKVTIDLCRYCVLHTERMLNQPGVALCHNITANKVSDDLAFDLGCALVELLQRDLDTETAQHGIVSLCQCINSNLEVGAVAVVSGLDTVNLAKKHPNLKNLCDGRLTECLNNRV